MKDFFRTNLNFSLCGLNCRLCPMRLGGYCPGCGGGEGNQTCAIAKCSRQHANIEYCFLCPEYPCLKYEGTMEYDSFITHQRQTRDLERAQEIGLEAYNREQDRKAEILSMLLSDYNDGRRKTFYCIAVNLLPLKDIEDIIKQVSDDVSQNNLTITMKERAEKVISLFQNSAIQQGLVLKLRKKPAEQEQERAK